MLHAMPARRAPLVEGLMIFAVIGMHSMGATAESTPPRREEVKVAAIITYRSHRPESIDKRQLERALDTLRP